MLRDEKFLLLQLILEDFRGNWANQIEPRAEKALALAEELELKTTWSRIQSFLFDYRTGEHDGRIFRCDFSSGGYLNMDEQHGLKRTICDKTKEFQEIAIQVLTYPDSHFEDWDEFENGATGDIAEAIEDKSVIEKLVRLSTQMHIMESIIIGTTPDVIRLKETLKGFRYEIDEVIAELSKNSEK